MGREGYTALGRGDFALTRSASKDYLMDFHVHDDFEVYYSLSGGRFYLIEDKVYEINPNDLFVINSNEAHKAVPSKDAPYERYVLTFRPDVVLNYCTDRTDLLACFTKRPQGFSHKLCLSPKSQSQVLLLFRLIGESEGYGADVRKTSYLMQLLLLINEEFIKTQDLNSTCDSNIKIKPILDYINKNLAEAITLAQLESEFHINKYYLCHLFKRYTGTSMSKYIVTRRLAEAKKLLGQGVSVTEACQASGFNDYCHFIRTFTNVVGVSPKKYGASVLEN